MLSASLLFAKLDDVDINYKCGGCEILFENIYILHDHLRDHVEGGSYNYNHKVRTAFPVYVSKDANTQTCSSDTDTTRVDVDAVHDNTSNVVTTLETYDHKQEDVSKYWAHEIDAKRNYSETESDITDAHTIKSFTSHSEDGCNAGFSAWGQNRMPSMTKENPIDGMYSVIFENGVSCKKEKNEDKVNYYKKIKKEHNVFRDLRVNLCEIDCQAGKRKRKKTETVGGADINLKQNVKLEDSDIGQQTYDMQPKTNYRIDQNPVVITRKKTTVQVAENKYRDISEYECIMVKCEKCNKLIKSTSMARHLVHFHKEASKPRGRPKKECNVYRCEKCDKIIQIKSRRKHERTHLKLDETSQGPAVCEICGIVYTSFRGLTRHRKTHTQEYLTCRCCEYVAPSKDVLDAHMKTHKSRHICQVCGAVFTRNKQVLRHVRSVHMGEKRYQCDICEKQFFTKYHMTAHKAIHFEPKLSCPYCCRIFREYSSLKRHEKIHTGQKMYSCHICNHSFIQSTPYWVHMEKKHSIPKSEAIVLRQNRLLLQTN